MNLKHKSDSNFENIYLYNTLSKSKEKFVPIREGEVGMYHCGPTVYNVAHIGNLRSYVFADTLRRIFEFNGYKVKQVINITDIGHLTSDADEGEDKMVKALKREGEDLTLEALKKVGHKYFDLYKQDLTKLNILLPNVFAFASEHIAEDVSLVEILLNKDIAYKISDGIYFDISKYPEYGKLGGSASDEHSRVGINPEKRNSQDFALWKFADSSQLGFEAPFGVGFPGWHIECSAMAMKYLGETFDIHTGGVDHVSIHHNNEIAQSEAATGKPFAHYWMHNNFITMGEEKMAKSEGNVLSLDSLEQKGLDPLAYRYWLLTSRYSTRVDYSSEALEAAQNAHNKLKRNIQELPEGGSVQKDLLLIFTETINDDLNTPESLAFVWKILKDEDVSPGDKKATILEFDKVLGLKLDEKEEEIVIPQEVLDLAKAREQARKEKNWAESDRLRDEIQHAGFIVKDTQDGPKILPI